MKKLLMAIVLAGAIACLVAAAFKGLAVEIRDRQAYHADAANRIITGAGNTRDK